MHGLSAFYYRRIVTTNWITDDHIVIEHGAMRSSNNDEVKRSCLRMLVRRNDICREVSDVIRLKKSMCSVHSFQLSVSFSLFC